MDAFEDCGAPLSARYTWDTETNDNTDTSGYSFKPRARYDRMFATQVRKCAAAALALLCSRRMWPASLPPSVAQGHLAATAGSFRVVGTSKATMVDPADASGREEMYPSDHWGIVCDFEVK